MGTGFIATPSVARTVSGDPKKAAAAALLHVATLDQPPLRLLLGSDAARAVEEAERARSEADKKWRQLSESTDFITQA